MTRVALLAAALFAAGCPSDPGGGSGGNPPQFWLALNGSELRVKLVPIEPDPF